ncbi:MAG TPA: hypothetical protein VFG14_09140 [Chthoniobacteraceae bacterium]|nr:hypothetical protein [Chthoniobacteraceae bacterium]
MTPTKPYPNNTQEAGWLTRADMFRRQSKIGLNSGNGCDNTSPQREAGT